MLRNFVSSTGKIYQWDFPKVAIVKRSTKGGMRSSFRRALVLNLLLAEIRQKCNV